MAKPHKPSSNAQAFEREVKRLQRLVKIAENKGIVFISSPIPEKPNVVTRKKLNLIKSITKSDIESKGYTLDKETGELQNYVPPKKSKARTSSPRSYKSHSTAPHIPTPPKPKLSEEELHRVRSESAKKAAQTRKEREATDVEYAKRMQEQRRKALEKAREARRRFEQEHPEEAHAQRSKAAKKAAETRRRREQEDAEYKKRMDDIRRKALEKAREANQKKREQEQQEQPKPQTEPEIPIEEPEPEEESQIDEPQEEPDYTSDYSELPSQGDAILANVRSELSGAVNSHIAQYLLDLLEDEIDANGEDVVIERLATASERSIEMANGASYASDSDDVANCAYSLADLITGGDIGGFMGEEIEQLAFEDRPYRRKRR